MARNAVNLSRWMREEQESGFFRYVCKEPERSRFHSAVSFFDLVDVLCEPPLTLELSYIITPYMSQSWWSVTILELLHVYEPRCRGINLPCHHVPEEHPFFGGNLETGGYARPVNSMSRSGKPVWSDMRFMTCGSFLFLSKNKKKEEISALRSWGEGQGQKQ